ncbi:MAG: NAD-dependent epimerase/dehydratase family protein, partial [Methylophilaceae bacterium]
IDGNTDWSTSLQNVEVVIHLAARVHVMNEKALDPLTEFRLINVEGTVNFARQAALAGIKRFIYLSSIKVNGETTERGKPFSETDTPRPMDAYGISKFEAEQGLMKIMHETKMEVVMIRPPLVYGQGVKANFASLLNIISRKIPLPLGDIQNKRSFVYLGNLVSLIQLCTQHSAAANQVFLVSDGHDLSTTELLQKCAIAMCVKSRLISVPQKWIVAIATLLGKKEVAERLCGNLQVDITKANKLLGWVPPFSVKDGLEATTKNLS